MELEAKEQPALTYPEYQRRVLARASTEYHTDTINYEELRMALVEFINAGNRLDRVKKALFYGKPFEWDDGFGHDEVEDGLRAETPDDAKIIHACIGFATEGVELVECVFQHIFQKRAFDGVNLSEEFGDGEWYRALGLNAIQQTHEENLAQNDAKLEKRYGPAFSQNAALHRNLAEERATLVKKAAKPKVS